MIAVGRAFARAFHPTDLAGLRARYTGASVQGSSLVDLTGATAAMALSGVGGRVARAFNRSWEFGGRPCAQWITGGQTQAVAAAAADHAYLSKPAGATIAMCFVPFKADQLLNSFGNTSGNGTGVFLELLDGVGTEHLTLEVSRGGAAAFAVTTADGSVLYGKKNLLVARWSAAGGYDVWLNGAVVASGSAATLGAADPPFPLTIGAYANGLGAWSTFKLAELDMLDRRVTDAERDALVAYLTESYPDPSPLIITAAPLAGFPAVTAADVLYIGDSLTEGFTCATAPLLGGCRHRLYDLVQAQGTLSVHQIGPIGIVDGAHNYFAEDNSLAKGGANIAGNRVIGAAPAASFAPWSVPTSGAQVDNYVGPGKLYNGGAGRELIVVIDLGTNDEYGNADEDRWGTDKPDQLCRLVEWIAANRVGGPPRFVLGNLQKTFATTDHRPTTAWQWCLGGVVAHLQGLGYAVAVRDTEGAITDASLTCDNLHRNNTGGTAVGDRDWQAIKYAMGQS